MAHWLQSHTTSLIYVTLHKEKKKQDQNWIDP